VGFACGQANTTLKAKVDILRANLEDTRAEADIASALKAEVASLQAQMAQQQEQAASAATSIGSPAGEPDAAEPRGTEDSAEPHIEQAVEAARAEASEATQRADAAEAALADLRAGTELGEDAPAADVVAHILQRIGEARSQQSEERAAPTEAPSELTAALQRADDLSTQLAEAKKLRTDAVAHASQLTEQLAGAQEEARAAAGERIAEADAARAADATLHAKLEEAKRQVRLLTWRPAMPEFEWPDTPCCFLSHYMTRPHCRACGPSKLGSESSWFNVAGIWQVLALHDESRAMLEERADMEHHLTDARAEAKQHQVPPARPL